MNQAELLFHYLSIIICIVILFVSITTYVRCLAFVQIFIIFLFKYSKQIKKNNEHEKQNKKENEFFATPNIFHLIMALFILIHCWNNMEFDFLCTIMHHMI